MIKINMLRGMGLDQVGAGGGIGAGPVSADLQRDAAIKLAVIILIPALLILYEKFNLSVVRDELSSVQAQIQKAERERQSYGDTGPRVEKFTQQKVKIDRELETIRNLGKGRLQYVKALDALQSLMPAHCWLRKVSIKGGSVKIDGYTNAEDGVAELIRALNDSAYFSKVEPKLTAQEELPTGSAKRFDIEFKVGK
jgi:Tfp pilus assembly protein PilN